MDNWIEIWKFNNIGYGNNDSPGPGTYKYSLNHRPSSPQWK